jgi:uncharacterized protein (TIGR02996 family)
MTDEQQFIAAICREPENDMLRLVYADWCDENGQSDRAEFIRLQLNPNKTKATGEREWELLDAHWQEWVKDIPTQEPCTHREFVFIFWHRGFMFHGFFNGGFIDHFRTSSSTWAQVGHLIVKACPVREVSFHGHGVMERELVQARVAAFGLAYGDSKIIPGWNGETTFRRRKYRRRMAK